MEFTYTITSATTVRIQIDRSYQITVGFDVYKVLEEGNELYGSYSHGFPILTTEEEIHASLAKFCTALASDLAQHEADAELDTQLAHAEAVQRELLKDIETPE